MKQIELFAGVGGFGLAGEWAGIETICQVEIDPYCQSVLKKNFPNAQRYSDIRTFSGTKWRGVDIVSGGFPCQPYSHAGRQAGNDDDRALWPQMLRVIRETGARWVVGENVAGLISMDGGRVFAGIVSDLEGIGYSVEAFIIPACAKGAPHRRDRVWIVAHSNRQWQQQSEGVLQEGGRRTSDGAKKGAIAKSGREYGEVRGLRAESEISARQTDEPDHTNWRHSWPEHWLPVATRLCRVDDGLPARVDGTGGIPTAATIPKKKKATGRGHRLRALGNAIVPQIAYQIFKAIIASEQNYPV